MPNCISDKMFALTQKNSAVREMFEEGNRLAKLYGRENVYDFSLGNPNFPAPARVKDAVIDVLNTEPTTMVHGYMSNAGYPDTRKGIFLVSKFRPAPPDKMGEAHKKHDVETPAPTEAGN